MVLIDVYGGRCSCRNIFSKCTKRVLILYYQSEQISNKQLSKKPKEPDNVAETINKSDMVLIETQELSHSVEPFFFVLIN